MLHPAFFLRFRFFCGKFYLIITAARHISLLFKYAQASALRQKTRRRIVSVRYALMLPVKIASSKSGGR